MREKTCGNCKNIRVTDIMGLYIFGCSKSECIIPHGACSKTKKVTFWRVPKLCPRSDDEVLKSDKQAPKKEWVIKLFSDFTPEN